jgi:serine/threonine protein kinase
MLDQPAPTRIGGCFQVVRSLGNGGQGAVYLAEDTQLKRRFAIQTLTLKSIQSDQREARVEVLIVGQPAHPSIVTLYDAGLGGRDPGWRSSTWRARRCRH